MGQKIRFILALCAMFILPACSAAASSQAAPAAAATASSPAVVPTAASSVTATAVPSATAAPAATAADASEPGSTAVSAAPTDTPSSNSSAPVITAENAANLTAAALTLPEYPQRFLWVPKGTALPAGFSSLSSVPDLLAQSGANLYPIHLDPASFGKPAALPVPGMLLAIAPDLSSAVANPDPGSNAPPAIYDLNGKLLHTLDEPAGYGASYSADGRLLAVTSQNELAVILYDVATGQRLKKLTGFETAAPVYSAGIVPGNKTIYWISRATLEFQDVQTGQLGQKLNYTDFIGPFVFSPDGTRLALSVEGKLFLYSVPDAKQLAVITLSQPVSSLEMSPDGKLLVGGYNAKLQIWDAYVLAPVASLSGSDTSFGLVSFSPDGRYIVSEEQTNTVKIWK